MSLEARLLDFRKQGGMEYNALGRVLLESVATGLGPMTLTFNEVVPTVSIGNSQSCSLDVDREACLRHEVEIVRRDSGGQAVYIDENYLVFYLVGKPNMFPSDLSLLRTDFSGAIVGALQNIGVPAEFHKPDNVVIRRGEKIMTLGNSGQVITKDSILLQGSIRYRSTNFDRMIDVLKVNSYNLHQFSDEIRETLSDVGQYSGASKDRIKRGLVEAFSKKYGLALKYGALNPKETSRLVELSSQSSIQERLRDRESYKSRGVCYFFVDGINLVPSMHKILAYNKPSTVMDSTIELGGVITA